MAFALGLYLPNIIPMITEYYDEGAWGKTIAIHESATSLSIFAAPFIALFLLSFLPWRAIFIVIGSIMLLCAFGFQLAATDVYLGDGRPAFRWSVLKERALWIMCILWIFGSGCVLGLYFVLPLYLVKELGMNVQYANSIFGLSRIGMVLVTLTIGFFVDRVRLRKAMFLILLGTGVATMLLAAKDIRWIKVLLFVQAGIAAGYAPMALVAIPRVFDRETRGQGTAGQLTYGVGRSILHCHYEDQRFFLFSVSVDAGIFRARA